MFMNTLPNSNTAMHLVQIVPRQCCGRLPRHATPRHADTPRHATPRPTTPRHATPHGHACRTAYLCVCRYFIVSSGLQEE